VLPARASNASHAALKLCLASSRLVALPNGGPGMGTCTCQSAGHALARKADATNVLPDFEDAVIPHADHPHGQHLAATARRRATASSAVTVSGAAWCAGALRRTFVAWASVPVRASLASLERLDACRVTHQRILPFVLAAIPAAKRAAAAPSMSSIAAPRDLVQRAKPQPPHRKTAVDRFAPEGEYRAGARRHALKPLNLLAKAKDGRWLNRSTHSLVKRFQSGIVLDLFQSEGKSQMAGHVPEDLAALQQCRSPCEHEGNRGV
jgi:hypothetical protein